MMLLDKWLFCQFCSSSSHATTTCLSIPPQIRAVLMNMREVRLFLSRDALDGIPLILIADGHLQTMDQHHRRNVLWTPPVCPIYLDHETAPLKYIYRKGVCNTAALEALKAKDKRMVSFAPSDRPPDAVASDMRRSHSSSTPHKWRGSVTFIVSNTDKKWKPDEGAKGNIRTSTTVVKSMGMKHQAADALPRLNTTRTDQTPIEDEITVLCIITSIPRKRRQESYICIVAAYIATRMELEYANYKLKQFQKEVRTRNTQ